MKNKLIIWTLGIVLLASIIYAGNLNSNSDLSQNEYTQYLGYSNQTIYFNNTLGSPNSILWYRELSDFCNSNTTYATPLAYKGKLYFNCPNETKIYCLNATTGVKIWNFTDTYNGVPGLVYNGTASNAPYDNNTYYNYRSLAIANDTLIYYAGNNHLYAFNAATGNVNWYTDMNYQHKGLTYVYSDGGINYSLSLYAGGSPIIYNNYVYVNTYATYTVPAINPQVILRFNLTTDYTCSPLPCKQVRDNSIDNTSLFTSNENYYGLLSAPMIFNNSIYVTEYNGGFFAFNASNLSMEWNDTTATAYEYFERAGIIIYNQTLFTQGNFRIHAYDLNSKTHLCTYTKATSDPTVTTSTPTIYRYQLYAGGSRLRIVNYTNCNLISSWTYGNDEYKSSPVAIGNNVYAGTSNATLIINGTDTTKATLFRGNTTQAYASGTPDLSLSYFYSNPMVADNIIYLTGNRIYAMIDLRITNYTVFYNDTVVENTLESFGINVTYNYLNYYSNSFAYLNYNTTIYNTTRTIQANSIYFNVSLIIPSNTSTNNFFWNLTIDPYSSYGGYIPMSRTNTSEYKQNITQITSFVMNNTGSCHPNLSPAMCWNFKDENSLAAITSVTLKYNFNYGISNSSLRSLYGNFTTTYFCLCVNSTAYNNYTLGYGELYYQKTSYADRRFYTFSNNRLSNSTINNTLYLLGNVMTYGTVTYTAGNVTTTETGVNTTTMSYGSNVTTYTTTGNITITVTQGNTTQTSYSGNITAYYNSSSNQTYTIYNPSSSSQVYDPSITQQIYDPSTAYTIYSPSITNTTSTPTMSITSYKPSTTSTGANANPKATEFIFEFKNTGLVPYISNYSALLRWYPQFNSYYVVDMGKTDNQGKTIMNVEAGTTDYRVGLYDQSGNLRKLLDPTRFKCLDSCSFSSLIEDNPADYTSVYSIQNSIDYNYTYGIWTYVWNDPSQNTNSMRFTVTKDTGYETVSICDTNATGFTGVLTCNSSLYRGVLKGTAYRTASPETPIFNKIVEIVSSPFTSRTGLFISFILFIALVGIGVYSPAISLIFGIGALFVAVRLGAITMAILIPLAVIVGLVIHFFKRTTQ